MTPSPEVTSLPVDAPRGPTAEPGTCPLRPAWSYAPVPGWVDPVPAGIPCDGKVPVVLFDEQRHFLDARSQYYLRVIYRVRDAEDVQTFGHMRIPIAHERTEIAVHTLGVYRGQQAWRHTGPEFMTTIPGEPAVVAKEIGPPDVVHGEPAALVLRFPDLRIGDYLEVAYTQTYPVDPAFAGVVSARAEILCKVPAQRLRIRILLPNRPIAVRMLAARGEPPRRQTEDYTELVFQGEDMPSVPRTLDHARRKLCRPQVEFSELADWDAVVRLCRPFYNDDEPPPGITTIAEAIAREHPSPRARVLAVMRLVQDEFAYEIHDMREWLFRPKPLARVLTERATDCKGKTLLMLSILQALGIDAAPVLVHRHGADLRRSLPVLTDLDHVIVMVTLAGRDYFIDPTLRHQRGDLDDLSPLPYLTGLPLVLHRGLVEISHGCGQPRPGSELFARYRVGAPGKPAQLHYERIDRGGVADTARKVQRSGDPVDFHRQLSSGFGRIHPNLYSVTDVDACDDGTDNTYRVTATLRFQDIWRRDPSGEPTLDVLPVRLLDELGYFVQDPICLHHRHMCYFASWTSTLQLPFVPRVEGSSNELQLPGLRVRHTVDTHGTRMTIRDTVELCCHAITDVDAVLHELRRIPGLLRVRIRPPTQALVVPPGRGETATRRPFRPRFR